MLAQGGTRMAMLLCWDLSSCSACHGIALHNHPMHAYLVCRSSHASF